MVLDGILFFLPKIKMLIAVCSLVVGRDTVDNTVKKNKKQPCCGTIFSQKRVNSGVFL